MNKALLCGRLTADPTVSYSNDKAIARFTLAVDRAFKKEGEQTADFISCVAFGKSAEFLEKYVKKGTKLIIEGRIQTGNYTNKDGVKIFTTDVIVEHTEFAESKGSANAQPSESKDFESVAAAIDSDFEEIPFS